MTEQAGQILRMARPAAWWARRAALHHSRGNRRQAEVLYQHAVALTPDSVPLKLAYARVLQEARRYEASNRQAFAALALDPQSIACIGLIGQNLMALGYLDEAADAFAHALNTDSEGMAEAYGEQLDRLEELLEEPADCSQRYRILVQRAAEDLAAGEWEAAGQWLDYACALPRRDERCHALRSLYFKARGDKLHAVAEAEAACFIAPGSCRAWCSLAELYGECRRPGKALKALLLAAQRALTAGDEKLLCQTAVTLKMISAVLPTLSRIGGRVQTLYDTAVLLLMAGQAGPALEALDRCRALDPDDVPTRYLRRTAQALAALPKDQAAARASKLRLYPALSDADSEACYRDFLEALADGTDAFARRLMADGALYRLTLYQAENPYTDISGLLEQVIPLLNENFTVRMLRELLLLPAGGFAEKQLAIGYLMQGEAKPFVLWHGGRLSFIRPHGGGGSAEALQVKDLLLRCCGCDPALMTHALRLLRKMPPRMRLKLAAERGDDFLLAVRMHSDNLRGAVAKPPAFPRLRHVRRLYRMLVRVAPAPAQAAPPRLWLSKQERRPHETD